MNYNKAVILGRLTHDPEMRSLPSGQSVVSFSMATNRVWNDQSGNKQEKTEFHNIVAFGKLADICGNYLSKGRLILIEGRLQTNNWEGKDGVKRYRTEIIAENMQMGPRPADQDTTGQGAPTQNQNSQPKDVEDIPVIEAEEPIKDNQEEKAPTQDQDPDSKDPDSKDIEKKVNLKNIPF